MHVAITLFRLLYGLWYEIAACGFPCADRGQSVFEKHGRLGDALYLGKSALCADWSIATEVMWCKAWWEGKTSLVGVVYLTSNYRKS